MSYDTKCAVLAEQFLSDHPPIDTRTNRQDLSQEIQNVIENFIETATESEADNEK